MLREKAKESPDYRFQQLYDKLFPEDVLAHEGPPPPRHFSTLFSVTHSRSLGEGGMQILFVCSRNRIRSLTAERIFQAVPGWTVRSAGTQPEARIVVTEALVSKSDIIVAMEKSHTARLRRRFGRLLDQKRVITLHIPDEYSFMQPELMDELIARVGEHFPIPQDFTPPDGGR